MSETEVGQTVHYIGVDGDQVVGDDVTVGGIRLDHTKSRNIGTLGDFGSIDQQLAHRYEDAARFSRVPHEPARNRARLYQIPSLPRRERHKDMHFANHPALFDGAADLTRRLLADRTISGGTPRDSIYFIGGDPTDYASARRIEAFRDVLTEAGSPPQPGQIIACGYAPRSAMREIAALFRRLVGLPAGILVNSLTVFEGVLGHLSGLPLEDLRASVIGCYDYDPFAAYLQFPVHMVRQDAHGLIQEAYQLIDQNSNDLVLKMVEPEQIAPRTFYDRLFSDHG